VIVPDEPYRPSAAEDGSAEMALGPPRTPDGVPHGLPIPAQTDLRRSAQRPGEYVRARTAEDDHAQRERAQAARTVAGNARNYQDCRLLLSILGLDPAEVDRSGRF
jgi:hypothetical protein